MALVRTKSRVVYSRNRAARYAKQADAAAMATVEEIIKQGARESRRLAPVGAQRDKRPGHTPLKRSIKTRIRGREGVWYSTSKHAMPIEVGAKPHFIVGKGIKFFWAKSGRWFWWNHPSFGPGSPYQNWDPANGVVISHPGNKPQPFLEPAFEKVARHGATVRTAKRIYKRFGL